jgi:hypothetical protein
VHRLAPSAGICLLLAFAVGTATAAPGPLTAPASPTKVVSTLTVRAIFVGWNQTGVPCGGGAFSIWGVFTGNASGGSPPDSFLWEFGDGSPASRVQNPTHVFASNGPWNVNLTVTDLTGAHASSSVLVTPPIFNCPAQITPFPSPSAPWEAAALLALAVTPAVVGLAVLLITMRRRPPS